jgi:hypothetical protein
LPQEKEENNSTDCPKRRRKIAIQVAPKRKGGIYFYRLPQAKEENSYTVCPKRRRKIIVQIAPREG